MSDGSLTSWTFPTSQIISVIPAPITHIRGWRRPLRPQDPNPLRPNRRLSFRLASFDEVKKRRKTIRVGLLGGGEEAEGAGEEPLGPPPPYEEPSAPPESEFWEGSTPPGRNDFNVEPIDPRNATNRGGRASIRRVALQGLRRFGGVPPAASSSTRQETAPSSSTVEPEPPVDEATRRATDEWTLNRGGSSAVANITAPPSRPAPSRRGGGWLNTGLRALQATTVMGGLGGGKRGGASTSTALQPPVGEGMQDYYDSSLHPSQQPAHIAHLFQHHQFDPTIPFTEQSYPVQKILSTQQIPPEEVEAAAEDGAVVDPANPPPSQRRGTPKYTPAGVAAARRQARPANYEQSWTEWALGPFGAYDDDVSPAERAALDAYHQELQKNPSVSYLPQAEKVFSDTYEREIARPSVSTHSNLYLNPNTIAEERVKAAEQRFTEVLSATNNHAEAVREYREMVEPSELEQRAMDAYLSVLNGRQFEDLDGSEQERALAAYTDVVTSQSSVTRQLAQLNQEREALENEAEILDAQISGTHWYQHMPSGFFSLDALRFAERLYQQYADSSLEKERMAVMIKLLRVNQKIEAAEKRKNELYPKAWWNPF